MLHNVIEKNERFLRFCCKVAHTISFVVILIAFLQIAYPLSAVLWAGSPKNMAANLLQTTSILGYIKFLFLIFLFLGIEQFIRCLIDIDFKPNWILRYGDKIIYLYALYLFVTPIYYCGSFTSTHNASIAIVVIAAIFAFIKSILWIGIGKVLKIIVPIIQESKTTI
ncbi:MAG: hypothetical protein WC770_05880 [Phycisphaerae bacterium]|jgi:hypothetical protein